MIKPRIKVPQTAREMIRVKFGEEVGSEEEPTDSVVASVEAVSEDSERVTSGVSGAAPELISTFEPLTYKL